VPDGFFGVMWDRAATRAPGDEQERQWALVAQSGVQAVRAVVAGARAQPVDSPGAFSSRPALEAYAASARRFPR
jgi:hypothetical protein